MSAVANKVGNLRKRAISTAGFGHIEPRPPPRTSPAYDLNLATLASRVLYRSGPDPSGSGGPLLILCAAAFPDTRYVDYNKLLPYVLSELPGDEELMDGMGYSVVFFAGGGGEKPGGETHGPLSPGAHGAEGTTVSGKWNRPAWSWSLQAYNLLSRAVRKNIRRLWIVHERAWVRILFEAAQTVVSPKFKKKVVHVNSLSELAAHIPLQTLNIPPQVYLHDRKIDPSITVPNPPPPMFGVQPFPPGEIEPTLPLVLIESSRYIKSAHLKTEGIFRISCSMQLLDIVREAYDRGQYMRSYDYGPHVAAGLVKLYYRTLPEPLIPKRYYQELPEKCKTPEGIKVLLTRHEREGGLPSTSRILLTRHLLPLLAAVAAHAGANKMTPENLAICVSPSLVRSEDPLVDITISRGSVCQLIRYGIEHIDEVSKGKQTVRQGKREMNTKRGLEKLIILDGEGDRELEKEEGLGREEQEEVPPPLPRRRTEVGEGEQEEVSPLLPKRPAAVKRAEGSPLTPEQKGIPWSSEFGGPLPMAPTKLSTSTPPQALQQQQHSPSSPVPRRSPIEGIPLSLQPALQPALQPILANPSLAEPLIPPPLSEQPTPNLPPTIPPKPTALSTTITPDPLIPLPVETIAPPGHVQVNTRRPILPPPSSQSLQPAKIDINVDIDSNAVAKSVAKFQALAAAARIPLPSVQGRAGMAAEKVAMGMQQDEPENGSRMWRTRLAKHLQPPLPLREIGQGPGMGSGEGATVKTPLGRGLRKATSDFDLKTGGSAPMSRSVNGGFGSEGAGTGEGPGTGTVPQGGGLVRKKSFSSAIGNRLNQFENQNTTETLPRAMVPRRARSNIDFKSSTSTSTNISQPPPGLAKAYTVGAAGGKRMSIVEELRMLYEERAKGVEVLVQVGNAGRRGSVYSIAGAPTIPEEGGK